MSRACNHLRRFSLMEPDLHDVVPHCARHPWRAPVVRRPRAVAPRLPPHLRDTLRIRPLQTSVGCAWLRLPAAIGASLAWRSPTARCAFPSRATERGTVTPYIRG